MVESLPVAQPIKSFVRRVLGGLALLVIVIITSVIASRLAVEQLFHGIAAQRSTGLAAFGSAASYKELVLPEKGISKNVDLESRTTAFEESTERLRRLVGAHHGEFEDLRTENRSGQGRSLAAAFTVPVGEFDATMQEVKSLGKVERISEASEDVSVSIARLSRQAGSARDQLSRLESLQHNRRGGIQDALALQKEIAQAAGALAQVEMRSRVS